MRLLLVALAACSVPGVDLNGKSCPCVAGYTCNEATQVCVLGSIDDAAPMIDAPDAQPLDAFDGVGCLGIPAAVQPAFSDDFASLAKFTTSGGSWILASGEAQQTDAVALSAFAVVTAPINGIGNDYRVTVRARQLAGLGSGAIEVAFRKQPLNSAMTHCRFEPNSHVISIVNTDVENNNATLSPVKTLLTDASYDPHMTMTIEASVTGASATCCIREIPDSTVTTNLQIPDATGLPGMRTVSMSGAFDEFRVYPP